MQDLEQLANYEDEVTFNVLIFSLGGEIFGRVQDKKYVEINTLYKMFTHANTPNKVLNLFNTDYYRDTFKSEMFRKDGVFVDDHSDINFHVDMYDDLEFVEPEDYDLIVIFPDDKYKDDETALRLAQTQLSFISKLGKLNDLEDKDIQIYCDDNFNLNKLDDLFADCEDLIDDLVATTSSIIIDNPRANSIIMNRMVSETPIPLFIENSENFLDAPDDFDMTGQTSLPIVDLSEIAQEYFNSDYGWTDVVRFGFVNWNLLLVPCLLDFRSALDELRLSANQERVLIEHDSSTDNVINLYDSDFGKETDTLVTNNENLNKFFPNVKHVKSNGYYSELERIYRAENVMLSYKKSLDVPYLYTDKNIETIIFTRNFDDNVQDAGLKSTYCVREMFENGENQKELMDNMLFQAMQVSVDLQDYFLHINEVPTNPEE